ncbi:MAG: glycine betaine ABC transporter substrate-binding protein, partial [Polyangiales bacterium]
MIGRHRPWQAACRWLSWVSLSVVAVACTPAPSSKAAASSATPVWHIASKLDTESVILAEMLRLRLAQRGGGRLQHRRELGGSRIVFRALERGTIDVYPEYTGTLRRVLLTGQVEDDSLAALRSALAAHGLQMSAPLGFDNNYALGMNRRRAQALGIRRISDLSQHSGLRFAFSHEFLDRPDGWQGIQPHYGLNPGSVRGMSHQLSYRALAAGDADVIDVYSTEGQIVHSDVQLLQDDRDYFPRYAAVYLWRNDGGPNQQALGDAIADFASRLRGARMRRLNASALRHPGSETRLAA